MATTTPTNPYLDDEIKKQLATPTAGATTDASIPAPTGGTTSTTSDAGIPAPTTALATAEPTATTQTTTQPTTTTQQTATPVPTEPTPMPSKTATPVTVPTQPIDPGLAINQIGYYFESQFGRPMSEAEKTQLIQASGYTSGLVTPQQFQLAMSLIDQYNGGQKTTTPTPVPTPTPGVTPLPTPVPTPTPPPAAPAPQQGIDPNVAMNQAQSAFQAKFGRPMSEAEQQQLIAALGLQPGQPITQADVDRALAIIASQPGGTTTGVKPGGPGETVEPLPPVITAPGGTPGTPTPTTPPGGIDPNEAMNQAQAAFQARFGRPMTSEEQQQLIAAIGLQPGQAITQAHIDQALKYISEYGGGAPTQPGTPTPTTPGAIDPNVAMNQAQSAFQARFGRPMTAQEQQALITALGLQPGQPITQAHIDQAMALIAKYSGNIGDPWGTPTPTPGGTTPPPPTSGGPGGNPPGVVPTPPVLTEADKRLMELLSQKWGEVDPNDPALRGQRESFELANQRETTRKRAALAERAAARGGIQSGGFDVDQERLLSEQGEGNTAFGAQLYANELKDQRVRLMEGIKLATQAGLQQEAQKLQEELAKLDIQLRAYLGQGQLGLGLLNSNRQDQQFYDNLGVILAKLGIDMDNDAIMAMLGGG